MRSCSLILLRLRARNASNRVWKPVTVRLSLSCRQAILKDRGGESGLISFLTRGLGKRTITCRLFIMKPTLVTTLYIECTPGPAAQSIPDCADYNQAGGPLIPAVAAVFGAIVDGKGWRRKKPGDSSSPPGPAPRPQA